MSGATRLFDRARSLGRKGHFSNFGEQEIIEKYLRMFEIDRKSKMVVDIGAGDGVRHSNTFNLLLRGWNILGIECDESKFKRLARNYRFHQNAVASSARVTSTNVVDVLRSCSVDEHFGILSIDIDGCDYWVLDSLLLRFRPRLIISEYNEKIPPPIKFVVNDAAEFKLRHHFYGYSIAHLSDLLAKHEYVLLEVEFNNVFLAPAEIAGDRSVDLVQAYRQGYVDRADRKDKFGTNANMDVLLSLSPQEGVNFLNDFYVNFRGEYRISPDY